MFYSILFFNFYKKMCLGNFSVFIFLITETRSLIPTAHRLANNFFFKIINQNWIRANLCNSLFNSYLDQTNTPSIMWRISDWSLREREFQRGTPADVRRCVIPIWPAKLKNRFSVVITPNKSKGNCEGDKKQVGSCKLILWVWTIQGEDHAVSNNNLRV
jgi:hypothetical protein